MFFLSRCLRGVIDVCNRKPFFLDQSIGDSALQVNEKGFTSYGIPSSRFRNTEYSQNLQTSSLSSLRGARPG
jgi:hypothetical protein